MKEDFFKVGYTNYLKEPVAEKKKWTSKLLDKIVQHKFITTFCVVILTCMVMNLWLIYKFVNILYI